MSISVNKDFVLTEELNKTIVQSLVSSFALDFLLFEDKKGGDVATIHNVRQHQKGESDIQLSEQVKHEYQNEINKGYDSKGYHSDPNYVNRGKDDKRLHRDGWLDDTYRNQIMGKGEKRQLDHVISSHEVHSDAGRVLAGLDGISLANQDTNFQSTHSYINNLKSAHSMDEFLNEVVPRTVEKKKSSVEKNKEKLDSMPTSTKEERHKKRELEEKIVKDQEHIDVLESMDAEKMREVDEKARKAYNKQINIAYYSSSKFLKNTAQESVKSGFKMGMRQAVGLVLAEVWFELKEHLPSIFKKLKGSFSLDSFLVQIKQLFSDIWGRIKSRFKDVIEEFKSGALAGALSSLSTTIMNIFFTTQKLLSRLVREMWSSLVAAAKAIFFNPHNLSAGDLTREIIKILSTGVAVAMGVILNQHLATVMTFPLGTELASFISAVATGLMTLGMTYFLDHSDLMQKVWKYLDRFKSEARRTLEYFQKVNEELDRYLVELSALEFNMSPNEMKRFSDSLESISCEYEKGLVLSREIERRNIELPFEENNIQSTRNWLKSL